MSYVSASGVGIERTRMTVAELLSQRTSNGPTTDPATGTRSELRAASSGATPPPMPWDAGSTRRGLALTVGTVLATGSILTGSIVYAGTLGPHHPGNRTLGIESAESGHPSGQPAAQPRAVSPAAHTRASSPPGPSSYAGPAARPDPVSADPQRARPRRLAPTVRHRGGVSGERSSGESTLGSLSPAVAGADSLLGTVR